MCDKKQKIYLIGIGMGSAGSMTREGLEHIMNCDCVIGARRVIETISHLDKSFYCTYQPDEIVGYINEHREMETIAVIYSGDIGFYSGAKKLMEKLDDSHEIVVVPGVSSVVYLAARLRTSWEDAALVSMHGRDQNYIHAIVHNRKTFVLLGDSKSSEEFCRKVKMYGLNDLKIWIGTNLSYENEQVIEKTAADVQPEDISGLTVVMVLNDSPDTRLRRHIEDDQFIRGAVPMTKSEIRSIILGKLQLTEDAVLYDIGAGTGSVSIEAALTGPGIRVLAIEQKPEAVELIRENCRKFYTDGVRVISGTAPEVLVGLESPTHVFIGGSSGNLIEILACVKRKNQAVRIVITAISLETVKMILDAEEQGLLKNPEIVQVTAAKSRVLGTYHMMTGQNPVYIVTEGE